MVSWPGTIAPGTTSDYAGQLFDLFPTMIEIAGGEVPTGIDAISLAPILHGESVTTKRDLYFVRREGGKRDQGLSRLDSRPLEADAK